MNREEFDKLRETLEFAHRENTYEASDYRAGTSYPIFVVQQVKRLYGVDPNFSWDGMREHIIADFEEFDDIEDVREYFEEDDMELDDDRLEIVYSARTWEDVNHHLTRESAETYILENRHNLSDPRIYVKSLYWCKEMIGLIDAIIDRKIEFE